MGWAGAELDQQEHQDLAPHCVSPSRHGDPGGCVVCHGGTGSGDGPATKRGVPIPPSLFTEQAVARKIGEIFHVVTYGKNNLNMPSYSAQIDRADRWKVSAYLLFGVFFD